jgi:hypothetical protein
MPTVMEIPSALQLVKLSFVAAPPLVAQMVAVTNNLQTLARIVGCGVDLGRNVDMTRRHVSVNPKKALRESETIFRGGEVSFAS